MPADGVFPSRARGHAPGSRWTAEEDAILLDAAKPDVPRSDAALLAMPRLPGRSPSAVRNRISELRARERRAADVAPSIARRGVSIRTSRITARALDQGALDYPVAEWAAHERPKTRGDCLPGGCNEARPCPFVSCRHHLHLSVKTTGSITLHHGPGVEPWELAESCALDVAERGRTGVDHGLPDVGHATLEEIGALVGITRERVRQIVERGLAAIVAGVDTATALAALDNALERTGEGRATVPPSLPVTRRYLPVVRAEAPPERPALDAEARALAAEARALAATRAPLLSPRTWERSAARRLP